MPTPICDACLRPQSAHTAEQFTACMTALPRSTAATLPVRPDAFSTAPGFPGYQYAQPDQRQAVPTLQPGPGYIREQDEYAAGCGGVYAAGALPTRPRRDAIPPHLADLTPDRRVDAGPAPIPPHVHATPACVRRIPAAMENLRAMLGDEVPSQSIALRSMEYTPADPTLMRAADTIVACVNATIAAAPQPATIDGLAVAIAHGVRNGVTAAAVDLAGEVERLRAVAREAQQTVALLIGSTREDATLAALAPLYRRLLEVG